MAATYTFPNVKLGLKLLIENQSSGRGSNPNIQVGVIHVVGIVEPVVEQVEEECSGQPTVSPNCMKHQLTLIVLKTF